MADKNDVMIPIIRLPITENRVIRIDHTKNGEYRAIPMNQRLLMSDNYI